LKCQNAKEAKRWPHYWPMSYTLEIVIGHQRIRRFSKNENINNLEA
jgi:hypothetical protein